MNPHQLADHIEHFYETHPEMGQAKRQWYTRSDYNSKRVVAVCPLTAAAADLGFNVQYYADNYRIGEITPSMFLQDLGLHSSYTARVIGLADHSGLSWQEIVTILRNEILPDVT